MPCKGRIFKVKAILNNSYYTELFKTFYDNFCAAVTRTENASIFDCGKSNTKNWEMSVQLLDGLSFSQCKWKMTQLLKDALSSVFCELKEEKDGERKITKNRKSIITISVKEFEHQQSPEPAKLILAHDNPRKARDLVRETCTEDGQKQVTHTDNTTVIPSTALNGFNRSYSGDYSKLSEQVAQILGAKVSTEVLSTYSTSISTYPKSISTYSTSISIWNRDGGSPRGGGGQYSRES